MQNGLGGLQQARKEAMEDRKQMWTDWFEEHPAASVEWAEQVGSRWRPEEIPSK
jgi:hypothetical protein